VLLAVLGLALCVVGAKLSGAGGAAMLLVGLGLAFGSWYGARASVDSRRRKEEF
jgi:hypothetical protein